MFMGEGQLPTVDLGRFDDIHAAVAGTSPILIYGIAGVFRRKLVDVIPPSVSLFVCFANIPLKLDPVTAVLGIKNK